MIKFFAVALVVGAVALLAWVVLRTLAASNSNLARWDPDERWGTWGRRLVAGLVAFGMAGMSASFSPRNVPDVAALVLALAAAALAGWWAGRLRSSS